jgi:AbrB family looped-hinge helix DNA binding protein
MRTKISTKGQVVLPSRIRRSLGLQPGDTLDAKMEGERIILTPRRARRGIARIVKDPVTGLPVLTAGADAAMLTSEQVREILADFP